MGNRGVLISGLDGKVWNGHNVTKFHHAHWGKSADGNNRKIPGLMR